MKIKDVTMLRIYLTEGDGQLHQLMTLLHDWEQLKGATVFRGISGFGDSGKILNAELMDLSLSLPVVVEFFDSAEKIEKIIENNIALLLIVIAPCSASFQCSFTKSKTHHQFSKTIRWFDHLRHH